MKWKAVMQRASHVGTLGVIARSFGGTMEWDEMGGTKGFIRNGKPGKGQTKLVLVFGCMA